MKYGPGEQAVPKLHSSGFNLLSALGCGRVGIPFLDIGGWVEAVLSSTKGRHICLEKYVGVCMCFSFTYIETYTNSSYLCASEMYKIIHINHHKSYSHTFLGRSLRS